MPRWRRAHGRSNATARARETTKYHNSRVLTATPGHFYSHLRQHITIAARAQPGKLTISSHPIPARHITCDPQRLPRALYLDCGTVCALPPRLQRQPADAILPPPRLASSAGIAQRHSSLLTVLCQHGCTPCRIAADNDRLHLELPVSALCRRVTGAAADALSRLASIGGAALALQLRSTSTSSASFSAPNCYLSARVSALLTQARP